MTDSQSKLSSPISQLLHSLGLTRDDLHRHSDQMRQFLTAEHANSLRALSFAQEKHRDDPPKPPSSRRSFTSSSISRSNSVRDASPESALTKIKSEPVEHTLPTRQFDSMEMVLERQSRQNRKVRKSRKMRERSHMIPQNRRGSPSPSRASSSSHPGLSLDSFMQSRDVRRVSVPEPSDPEPSLIPQDVDTHTSVTPSRSKYYRDFDTVEPPVSRSHKGAYLSRDEWISPSYHLRRSTTTHAVDSTLPSTPNARASPLPPSSPPGVSSSPLSSPVKIINTVSSPGPIDPLPLEEDYDDLPYTLPPGPYSTAKPELSYAALVGQAILSSPQHRLTLQEIYDWITIVYPHFQRGETTWMNSIRHVLSTTACFRKVVRDRSIGRTLWAIWDEDLPCFEGGGFKKQLCRDMEAKSKGTAVTRKRNSGPVNDNSPKKTKRARKERPIPPPAQQATNVTQVTHSYPFLQPPHGTPMFPPIRPTIHHQPYYESCLAQTIPADIIFPPLPPSVSYGYHHALAPPVITPATLVAETLVNSNLTSVSPEEPSTTSPRPSAVSWPSSMPGLTPNRSSSASPSLPSDAIATAGIRAAPELNKTDDVEIDDVFTVSGPLNVLEPGMTLLDHAQRMEGKKAASGKGRAKRGLAIVVKKPRLPPASPTFNRRATSKPGKQTREATLPPAIANAHISRCSTPPFQLQTAPRSFSPLLPTTPPGNTHSSIHQVELSPIRTPLSHRGLHMSPSASLVHYKSNLDPPPTAVFRVTPEPDGDGRPEADPNAANMRTPVRKRGANHINVPPVTPRRLLFAGPECGTQDSPLRTPSGRAGAGNSNGLAPSPFRTPGSRSIFDPHDPGALLDEELARLGGTGQLGYSDSPAGLFGKGIFNESPNIPSPLRWSRWW